MRCLKIFLWALSFILNLSIFNNIQGENKKKQTVPSPKKIVDSLCISTSGDIFNSDHTELAESIGIDVDWTIYQIHRSASENPTDLNNKIKLMHDKGKLYVHYLMPSVWMPDGHFSSYPELLNYAAIDIDGNRVKTQAGDHFTRYPMDILEPGWQQFIKKELKTVIDAGADGIFIDEIQNQIISILPPLAGVFNQPDMQGFNEFLSKTYPVSVLNSKFGIPDLSTFNYKDYIISKEYKNLWKVEPWKVPLYGEYNIYEYKATLEFFEYIIKWAKDYALSSYGKSIVFLGNTSNGLDISLPYEKSLDLSFLEFPYLKMGYPPLCKVIPASKVRPDNRWKKGTYQTQVPTNTDLQKRGNPANIAKLFLVEAYASQCEYQVPIDVPAIIGGYSPNLDILSKHFNFFKIYESLFSRGNP